MKFFTVAISMLFLILLAFACSNDKAIEKTISDFEEAANNNDLDAMKDTISPHSDWDVTRLQVEIMNHLYPNYTPLDFTNLIIDVDSPYADVESTALYRNTDPTTAWFVMRKEEKFLSFLFPDWKIKEFYDLDKPNDPIWKKIKKTPTE